MDSFTFNKIAGAVLGTCLVGMGINIVAEGIYEPGPPAKPGYALPNPTPEEAAAKAPAAAAAEAPKAPGGGSAADTGATDFLKLVASADPKKGQSDAQVCGACHNLKKGGGALIGPPLWNAVGHKKGSVSGYDYSDGLKKKGGDWTLEDLNTWLKNPGGYIPGTKMGYPGEANEKKRAEIVAYLRTLADSPVPIPADGDKTVDQSAKAPAPAASDTTPVPTAPSPASSDAK